MALTVSEPPARRDLLLLLLDLPALLGRRRIDVSGRVLRSDLERVLAQGDHHVPRRCARREAEVVVEPALERRAGLGRAELERRFLLLGLRLWPVGDAGVRGRRIGAASALRRRWRRLRRRRRQLAAELPDRIVHGAGDVERGSIRAQRCPPGAFEAGGVRTARPLGVRVLVLDAVLEAESPRARVAIELDDRTAGLGGDIRRQPVAAYRRRECTLQAGSVRAAWPFTSRGLVLYALLERQRTSARVAAEVRYRGIA